jgi:glycosyltransferase involved in cell wall biosynthesis
MPRVVVLTPFFRPVVGGSESNAERVARYLQAHGFDVRVVTKRITRNLPDTDSIDGLRVERIGPYGERSASGKWKLIPAATSWLARERETYDVVCCIDYRGIGLSAIAARSSTHRPVLLQAQTTGVLGGGGPLERAGKWLPRHYYRRGDAFACISRVIEREVLAAGIPRERVHHLPNAIDMTRFHPADAAEKRAFREQHGLSPDAVVCLFVGRLSREKGLMDLMRAWPTIERAVLLVAGPDMHGHPWDVGPEARAFVSQHPPRSPVQFLGSIADVAPLVRAADIVIQPSHFEALGLSAIEALASGVPVVASAVGGMLDFMAHGQNGLLCPAKNPDALATAVRTLVDGSDLRRRLAEQARPSVITEYDEELVFGRFAALVSQLAEGRM